jgi:hypothetical protein
MPKRTFKILPEIRDILHFQCAGSKKFENDMNNKIRENIIATIYDIDDEYFNDQEYGTLWKSFYSKFHTIISSLCILPFNKINIQQKAGMSHNYDFIISFLDENKNAIKSVNLEFKHNNTDVSKLCQFLELYDKDCKDKFNICQEMSYAEFYYDNYLDKYLKTIPEITCVKPDRNEYLKYVSDINYKHPFFYVLYENKKNEVNKKKQIANDSVKEYIKLYSSSFKFDKILEKIKSSQNDKVFLLWDCTNFHIQMVNVENIVITGIKKINNFSFDLDVLNFKYNICVRIRWANNNGLANPSWKFSFIRKQ